MAVSEYKMKIKTPLSGNGFNGVNVVSIITDSGEKATAFLTGMQEYLPNHAVAGLSQDLIAMPSSVLPASGTYTDVRIGRFNLKSARRRKSVYLPLKPDADLDSVISLIEANFVDEGADGSGTSAFKVESFSVSGQNVIAAGAVQPPSGTIV